MTDDIKKSAADIVTAYISRNPIDAKEVPVLLKSIIDTLMGSEAPTVTAEPTLVPAVPIPESVQPDYLICLEDGKHVTLLKRYLQHKFNMTPAEYIARWGLPADYPMVAATYSESRRQVARRQGLGKRA